MKSKTFLKMCLKGINDLHVKGFQKFISYAGQEIIAHSEVSVEIGHIFISLKRISHFLISLNIVVIKTSSQNISPVIFISHCVQLASYY